MRVALLGAAGTIAPAIVRDLAESSEVSELLLLDLDGDKAAKAAELHGRDKATSAAVDATDEDALAAVIANADVVVNSASYRINLSVMRAALAANCNYIDLGGLYHLTVEQLAFSDQFADKNLLALLGAGAGPGKTNVMAARAARELNTVETVRCASAGYDTQPPHGFSTPYALETLIDEITVPPMVFRDGQEGSLEPMTDGGEIDFLEPVGKRGSIYTLHSEVLTLPKSLNSVAADFRLSLSEPVFEGLKQLATLPRDELKEHKPLPPSAHTFSAQHVEVIGERQGQLTSVVVRALTSPNAQWNLGGGIISTASVAAASVRLLARGDITAVGALPPEQCLEPEKLFPELESRGCKFELDIQPLEIAGD